LVYKKIKREKQRRNSEGFTLPIGKIVRIALREESLWVME